MEKIILICYLNVGDMDTKDVGDYIRYIGESLDDSNDQVIHYLLPIRDGESRIECVNPKLVSDEDYIVAKHTLENTKIKLDEILKQINL